MRFLAQGLKDAGEGSRQHYDLLSASTVGCKWREMGKVVQDNSLSQQQMSSLGRAVADD